MRARDLPLTCNHSIILLTRPGQHPFDFWKADADDSGTEVMWVADFLPNEGFDRTRISILGNGKKDVSHPGQEYLDTIVDFVQQADVVSPSRVLERYSCLIHSCTGTRTLCRPGRVPI